MLIDAGYAECYGISICLLTRASYCGTAATQPLRRMFYAFGPQACCGAGRETVQILDTGAYLASSGQRVDLHDSISLARANTQTYPPERAVALATAAQHATLVTVTNETTLAAAKRLSTAGHQPVALNFASARHPGGGFLSGAQAQEESLARSSALYACLHDNPMYAWHETHRDPFYTDYAIYSPDVPVFRDDNGVLLDEPYLCAFITSPAVNARVALDRDPECGPAIRIAMARRIGRVLDHRRCA